MNVLSRMARFAIVDNQRDRAWPFERKPIRDADYLDGIALIRERWTRIRDEALALHRAGELDATTRLCVDDAQVSVDFARYSRRAAGKVRRATWQERVAPLCATAILRPSG